MEIAKLVLEYWKASVWPLVAITAVWLFRTQIRDALRRARTIDAMGINMKLAEQVDDAQAALAQARAGGDADREATAPDVVEAAREALNSVPNTRDISALKLQFPDHRVRQLMHHLDLTLAKLAIAFGHESFSREAAASIETRTHQPGWLAVYETYQLIKRNVEEPFVGSLSDRERFGDFLEDGIRTVRSLLENVVDGGTRTASEEAGLH